MTISFTYFSENFEVEILKVGKYYYYLYATVIQIQVYTSVLIMMGKNVIAAKSKYKGT